MTALLQLCSFPLPDPHTYTPRDVYHWRLRKSFKPVSLCVMKTWVHTLCDLGNVLILRQIRRSGFSSVPHYNNVFVHKKTFVVTEVEAFEVVESWKYTRQCTSLRKCRKTEGLETSDVLIVTRYYDYQRRANTLAWIDSILTEWKRLVWTESVWHENFIYILYWCSVDMASEKREADASRFIS